MIDLNHLFASHQTALFNSQQADCASERETYRDLVDFYAERIRRFREQADMPHYAWS